MIPTIEEVAAKIAGQERQILDDFAKAYLASLSLSVSTEDMVFIMKRLVLNRQDVKEEGKFGYKYWYTIELEDHGQKDQSC